ncbi:TetR/AcrR family transcriptional regulator [Pygmaiobacter massiliensis]|uniref:TetR/AcrR family transcriptional regulator n=1 Tax=Pygmaiobacter massiliensis TaxID=1917873 RepID=UPI0028A1A9C8|nr:TetR/AcrR family transcriptional regulator [Pygmaiobacter massiliensis]
MDRRQRKSREAILNAFNLLLTTKRYSEITVQDIIDKADVGRTTFYAHFETKDALLAEMCEELFEHIVNEHDEAENTHDFSKNDPDTETIITHILYHLKDKDNNIVSILKGESRDVFLPMFKSFLKQVFAEKLEGKFKEINIPEDFLLHFVSGSFVEMIDWWIQGGMKESPECLEQYFTVIMASVI